MRKSKGLNVDAAEVAGLIRSAARRSTNRNLGTLFSDFAEQLRNEFHKVVHEAAQRLLKDQGHVEAAHPTAILPQGTCMHFESGGRMFVVVQEPPRIRTLKLFKSIAVDPQKGDADRTVDVRSISLPYVLFIFGVTHDPHGHESGFYLSRNQKIAFLKKALSSPDDDVFMPIFPNIGSDLSICMSGTTWEGGYYSSPAEGIDDFRSKFWQAVFTRDYNQNWHDIKARDHEHFKSFATWERWSRKDPMYALKTPYTNKGSLRHWLDSMVGDTDHAKLEEIRGDLFRYDFNPLLLRFVEQAKEAGVEVTKYEIAQATEILEGFLNESTKELRRMYEGPIEDRLFELEKEFAKATRKVLGLEEPEEPEEPETPEPVSEKHKARLSYDTSRKEFVYDYGRIL
jgi:hypothetical protein